MTDYNRIKLNIFEKANDGLISEEQKIVLLEKAEFANMIANKDCILESYDRLLDIMESPEYIMETKTLENMHEFSKVKKEYKETLKTAKQHIKNKEYNQAKQDINKMVAQITILEKQLRENPPSTAENIAVNMMSSIVGCVKDFITFLAYFATVDYAAKTLINKHYGFKTPEFKNIVKSYHVAYATLIAVMNEVGRDVDYIVGNTKATKNGDPKMANKQIADFCKQIQKFKVNLAKTAILIDKEEAIDKYKQDKKDIKKGNYKFDTNTDKNDPDEDNPDMDNDNKANAEN